MTTLHDIIDCLNQELKVPKIDDFGPNGLQVEGSIEPITKIVTAVSTSLKTIEAAIVEKAQVLIVHHGLLWEKDSLCITGIKKDKIKLLLEHQISLLAYHLPLDCHQTLGNNWKAAMDLGWKDLKPFGPKQGEISLGVQGTFPSQSIEEFQKKLETYYGQSAHIAFGGKTNVSSAALISGGAHREIHRAVEAKVDCYITGSFDEPIWDIAHEEKINFLALGHYNTEQVGPKALGNYLENKFGLSHIFLHIPNPF